MNVVNKEWLLLVITIHWAMWTCWVWHSCVDVIIICWIFRKLSKILAVSSEILEIIYNGTSVEGVYPVAGEVQGDTRRSFLSQLWSWTSWPGVVAQRWRGSVSTSSLSRPSVCWYDTGRSTFSSLSGKPSNRKKNKVWKFTHSSDPLHTLFFFSIWWLPLLSS